MLTDCSTPEKLRIPIVMSNIWISMQTNAISGLRHFPAAPALLRIQSRSRSRFKDAYISGWRKKFRGGEGGVGSTPAKQWLSRTLGECLRHQHRSRNPIHPRYCIKSDRPDRFSKTTTMIRSHSGIAVEASKIVLAKGMQTLQNARVKKGERRMPVSPESWSIACLHWLSWYSPTIFKVVHTWLAGQINLPIYCPNMISNFANKVPMDFISQPVTGTCQSWMGKGTK